jgi:glycosyltransferase involved in cell wall biosynthesis
MESYFISVIIPTYNRAGDLNRCLKSLQGQTYKHFEVLVCDDGSTDNTIEVVDRYNSILDIQYIKDENFGGPARPRNNGLKKAKGSVIAFLDSDDWWYPNKLEILLPFLLDYDIIHHKLDVFTNFKRTNKVVRGRVLVDNIFKDLIINGNGIVNSSVLIKKNIVDLVGLFTEDRNLIAVEDYDYWIRVSMMTNRFKYIDKSLGAYWVGENISYSLKQINMYKSILDKYSKNLSNEEQKKTLFIYNYASARLYHSHLLFKQAKSLYIESFEINHLKFFLKSVLGYLLCVFRIKK